MRALLAALLGTTLALCGCGIRPVSVDDPVALPRTNSRLDGKRATVSLRDGRATEVIDVELGEHEITWVSLWSGEAVSVPAEDVRQVRVSAPGRGFVKLAFYTSVIWFASGHMPLIPALLIFGPPMWIAIGPPTVLGDADVYEIEYATPETSGSTTSPIEE